jgi:hypothetical protein
LRSIDNVKGKVSDQKRLRALKRDTDDDVAPREGAMKRDAALDVLSTNNRVPQLDCHVTQQCRLEVPRRGSMRLGLLILFLVTRYVADEVLCTTARRGIRLLRVQKLLV